MKSDFLIMKLMGGLGNQMFQVAAASKIAQESRREFLLDVSWYQNRNQADAHDSIPHVLQFPFLRDRRTIESPTFTSKFSKLAFHLGLTRSRNSSFMERNLEYPPDFQIPLHCRTYEGYFQSLKFIPEMKTVETIFEWPSNSHSLDFPTEYGKTSVALHLRLGDYVNSKIHHISNKEYIESAVRIIKDKQFVEEIRVFTDSPHLVHEYLPRGIHDHIRIAEIKPNPIEQLREIASFPHLIGSSSSFSWWAGYMNPCGHNKTVIVPSFILKGRRLVYPRSRFPITRHVT